MTVLAVDIGGTKLAAALVSDDGTPGERTEVPTPTGDSDDVWSALLGLVHRVVDGAAVAAVGVGCGGPMSWPSGRVSPLNIHGWRDFPLRDRLAARFPDGPVRIHNDAVCVAIAEHWRGAARGHANVLGMVVSTGVGGGLVLGDRVVDGATGNAGHVGHVVVEPDGPVCGCGGRGCLEAVARGPALVAWARERGWDGPDGVALTAAATAGDPVARAAFDRAGAALGVGIASAVQLCDVSIVTVAGGLAAAGPLLFDPLHAAYTRHAGLDFARSVPVVRATLGRDAGLVGAAALVLEDRYWPTAA